MTYCSWFSSKCLFFDQILLRVYRDRSSLSVIHFDWFQRSVVFFIRLSGSACTGLFRSVEDVCDWSAQVLRSVDLLIDCFAYGQSSYWDPFVIWLLLSKPGWSDRLSSSRRFRSMSSSLILRPFPVLDSRFGAFLDDRLAVIVVLLLSPYLSFIF